MLWACLHFPGLSVDLRSRGGAAERPLAVAESSGQRQWIHACDRHAHARGIVPGTTLAGAYALVPELDAHPRDERAETAALERIAAWAYQFSASVSLEPPHNVLVEIEGSRKLFGSLTRLLAKLQAGLDDMGYDVVIAVAPTPLAALILADAGRQERRDDIELLARDLAPVPLRHMRLPAKTLRTLKSVGARTVGDCLALPRDGLAKRFGRGILDYLDRLTGRAPDPRSLFEPPARFVSSVILPAEVAHVEGLLFAARRLLCELVGYLRARDLGVQRFELSLEHEAAAPTCIEVGLLEPAREIEHIHQVLAERLGRVELDSAVHTIGLQTLETAAFAPPEPDLLAQRERGGEQGPRLIERLRARLGTARVRGLDTFPEHRPERAWRYDEPGRARDRTGSPRRPLWLLAEPRPLDELNEALTLVTGPERIESGWWDGSDITRDYYIAESAAGGRYWVFQERRQARRWFLHGIFA